jgi:hypothetical protein
MLLANMGKRETTEREASDQAIGGREERDGEAYA